ncbi:LysR family transcriptional regulator [Albidovulum sediminicola]|uniref:LysR family transcriptional regulator n=1 Tax=Albidovulum sediminicola TaxID=2984331 RepID=A0ABT2Z248_9RHOB|nr:LysR family transcriptional regulator [Defluviimonas sp. WL0075]MCV2865223.1 LysR family transcriptional regulator [Defluviimonas sp. WL0075]
MPRNLDLTALRAFATVAETGGVTRAAGLLNLTQSAVSMQIKRLEQSLGRDFFVRAARKLTLTPEGEQLLGYARRMLELNDEALSRLTDAGFEGELRLGVPHDIVYPAIPRILGRFAALYPRVRINLMSSFTNLMHEAFARGELDLMLTTEEVIAPGGEELAARDLVWIGVEGGIAGQNRPLRLGFEEICRFRAIAQAALDDAGIPWEMGFSGRSNEAVMAMVAADLAVSVRMRGALPSGSVDIGDAGGLPPLGLVRIGLYDAGAEKGPVVEALKDELRLAYCCVI